MRDRWYGDIRDLIKWGGIKILCEDKRIKKVLWVAYLREDSWTEIKFDDPRKAVPVPDEVICHFKSIRKDLERLGKDLHLDIILVDDKIDVKYSHQNRTNYTKLICEYIRINAGDNKVVFLDPDTGLEPKRLEETHVSKEEVKKLWDSLNAGDYLVFYQHRFFDDGWREIRRNQLAATFGLSEKNVKMWFADESINNRAKLANDVVFYFIKKGFTR